MFIDSHCHLNYQGLAEDQPGVLERARESIVGTFHRGRRFSYVAPLDVRLNRDVLVALFAGGRVLPEPESHAAEPDRELVPA